MGKFASSHPPSIFTPPPVLPPSRCPLSPRAHSPATGTEPGRSIMPSDGNDGDDVSLNASDPINNDIRGSLPYFLPSLPLLFFSFPCDGTEPGRTAQALAPLPARTSRRRTHPQRVSPLPARLRSTPLLLLASASLLVSIPRRCAPPPPRRAPPPHTPPTLHAA